MTSTATAPDTERPTIEVIEATAIGNQHYEIFHDSLTMDHLRYARDRLIAEAKIYAEREGFDLAEDSQQVEIVVRYSAYGYRRPADLPKRQVFDWLTAVAKRRNAEPILFDLVKGRRVLRRH